MNCDGLKVNDMWWANKSEIPGLLRRCFYSSTFASQYFHSKPLTFWRDMFSTLIPFQVFLPLSVGTSFAFVNVLKKEVPKLSNMPICLSVESIISGSIWLWFLFTKRKKMNLDVNPVVKAIFSHYAKNLFINILKNKENGTSWIYSNVGDCLYETSVKHFYTEPWTSWRNLGKDKSFFEVLRAYS